MFEVQCKGHYTEIRTHICEKWKQKTFHYFIAGAVGLVLDLNGHLNTDKYKCGIKKARKIICERMTTDYGNREFINLEKSEIFFKILKNQENFFICENTCIFILPMRLIHLQTSDI